MRTQEQKQYDENGKYIHKCMKQNCNREETEGEELTASGRGGLSLQNVRWLYWHGGRATGFNVEIPARLVFVHLHSASLYQLIAVRVMLHFGQVEVLATWIAVEGHLLGSVIWARRHPDKRECQEPLSHQNSQEEL